MTEWNTTIKGGSEKEKGLLSTRTFGHTVNTEKLRTRNFGDGKKHFGVRMFGVLRFVI